MIDLTKDRNENNFEIIFHLLEKESEFKGFSKEQLIWIFDKKELHFNLGKKEKIDYWKLEEQISNLVKNVNPQFQYDVKLDNLKNILENDEDVFKIFVEKILTIQTEEFKLTNEKNEEKKWPIWNFVGSDNENLKNILETTKIKASGINYAKKLQDCPPNILTSKAFAEKVEKDFADNKNLKVKILNKQEIEKLNMNLLLAVNRASDVDPRVVIVEYIGDPNNQEKIALVGKGITFDTGGLSLKSWQYLSGMKFDMSGSAIAVSTLKSLSELNPKINVVAVCPLTDNKIGSKGTLVESVVQSMNGKFVEIEDTDAEGRLILADGITYAIRESKATKIFTIATLTGAASSALGPWFTCAMTNNLEFYNTFINKTKNSGERIWQMPVIREHYEIMENSKIGQISNFPGELKGGMSTAGAFLFSFSEDKPIIHLDIAGSAYEKKRGKGVMVKTLIDFLT